MTYIREMDSRHFLSPGPMHVYNFLTELLERFMVGVEYVRDGDHPTTLSFVAHDALYDAYLYLIKPVCERYGVGTRFFHTDTKKDIGRAYMSIPMWMVDSPVMQHAIQRANRSIRDNADVLLIMLEVEARDRRNELDLQESHPGGSYYYSPGMKKYHFNRGEDGRVLIRNEEYMPGPHPQVLNRVRAVMGADE